MEIEETVDDNCQNIVINGNGDEIESLEEIKEPPGMCSSDIRNEDDENGGQNGSQNVIDNDKFESMGNFNVLVNGETANAEALSVETQHSNGQSESVQINKVENTAGASLFDPVEGDIIIPSSSQNNMADIATDQNQEVIAISDDEEDPETVNAGQVSGPVSFPGSFFPETSGFLGGPGPSRAPSSNLPPLNFSPGPRRMAANMNPMAMPPPPPLRHMFPRSYGMPGPSDVITLSDDDDDPPTSESSSRKRKRSSRKRGTMFSPQICPYCYKPKRENICMSKHLIKHHWTRIRAQNMGNTKATDYANLKDDREIPVEKYKEERPAPRARQYSPPMSHYSGSMSSMSRSPIIEQPLRPSIGHVRGAFSRPPPMAGPLLSSGAKHDFGGQSASSGATTSGAGAGPSSRRQEAKSLGQEVAEELGHPSNRNLVKTQLSMLMHAHKCDARGSHRKQNSLIQEEKTCSLPDCASTKELLRHLPGCSAETDCPVAKCFMSKQIIAWALSPVAPGAMRETRSELARMAQAGLPREVVEWAASTRAQKDQWKSWRETVSGPPRPSGVVNNLPSGSVSITPVTETPGDGNKAASTPSDGSSSGQSSSFPTDSGNAAAGTNDWKLKYLKAREKMKQVREAKLNKNGSVSKQAKVAEKIIPSKASADILSSLLSAQSEVSDYRSLQKQSKEAVKGSSDASKKVPKLIQAPALENGISGEDAANFNSMLSL